MNAYDEGRLDGLQFAVRYLKTRADQHRSGTDIQPSDYRLAVECEQAAAFLADMRRRVRTIKEGNHT